MLIKMDWLINYKLFIETKIFRDGILNLKFDMMKQQHTVIEFEPCKCDWGPAGEK